MQISIRDLEHFFDQRCVLQGVDLELEKAQFYGVVGPNGSGKTTLLKLISQLIKAPKNKIYLSTQDLTTFKKRDLAKKLALVPQIFNIDFAFTVEEIVSMGRYPYLQGLSELGPKDHKIVEEALVKTDLLEYRLRDVNTLSGGELQRVVLARAIAQQTEVLLLDEPLSHLDIHHQLDILNLIKSLCQEFGMIAVCVMHDLNLTMKYCDQVIMIDEGSVFATGRTETVLTRENIQEVYDIEVDILRINEHLRIIY